jgi:hypothetical protein
VSKTVNTTSSGFDHPLPPWQHPLARGFRESLPKPGKDQPVRLWAGSKRNRVPSTLHLGLERRVLLLEDACDAQPPGQGHSMST